MSVLSRLFQKEKPVEPVVDEPMAKPIPKLHIFVDGSWLYRACGWKGSLANKLADANAKLNIDFYKLKSYLLEYARKVDNVKQLELGDCYLVMSIFSVPNNVDRYVDRVSNGHTITGQDIITAENAVAYREEFAQSALNVGFREDGVLRPELMHWHIVQIVDKTLREKQADTKLAALLVKYAITEPNDYLAVISGDQDILPAIEIASEFSHNVLLATNHHDENNSQSSSLLSKYDFRIKPVYLQHIVKHIMIGDNVYRCSACEHFFNADRPVDERKEQPRCPQCKTNRRNS